LPGVIAAQIEAKATNDGGLAGVFVGALGPGAMQEMFVSILPPELSQSVVEGGIDQSLAYVNGQSGQADVGLGSLNDRLASNSADLVDQYFDTLPDCTLLDALSMAGGLLGGGGADLPKCNPPDQVRETIAVPLQAALQEQLGQVLPGSVSLASGGDGLASLLSTIGGVRVAAELTPLIALFLFGLMSLVAVRSPRDLLRWWGIPLLISGILALLAGVVIGPATGGVLNTAVLSRLSASVAPALAQMLTQVTAAITSAIARPIILDAILVSILGGGLFLAARFVPETEGSLNPAT